MGGNVQGMTWIALGLALSLFAGVEAQERFAAGNVCRSGVTPDVDGVCPGGGLVANLQIPATEPARNPTCYTPDQYNTIWAFPSAMYAVRCFSPSTNISLTPGNPGNCVRVTRDEAVEMCSTFAGRENVTDWRLPNTPAEAGQGCGSGCGFDAEPQWLNFTHPNTTISPTEAPTEAPTSPTMSPTTMSPTDAPTDAPTEAPTTAPTAPTMSPTTYSPTVSPTLSPTDSPTSAAPTVTTVAPTAAPTDSPTSSAPTDSPTTAAPTASPTTESPASPNPSTSAAGPLASFAPIYLLAAALALFAQL